MKKLKILYLEDSDQDAEIVGHILKKAGMDFSFRLVDKQDDYRAALSEYNPDLVLSDHSMFQFNSLEALKIFKEQNLKIPFILVTGTVSEEFAVNILKQGADDYLLKDNLARLPNAIQNAMEKYRLEKQREEFLADVLANEALLKEAEHLAHFGSWEIDLVNNIVIWSDETFRIYGYKVGEIKPGFHSFFDHVHPEDVDALKKTLEEKLKMQDSYITEFRILDKSGHIKYINSKIVVERGKNGKPERIVGFNQDITDRKKTELNLINSFKELAKLERELIEQQLNQQKIITETTIQAQEKERNELGKELHDNINQILATVKMYLSMVNAVKEDKQAELLERSSIYVNEAIEEIRKLSKTLVTPSLGDIGLRVALEELTNEINFTQPFKVKLNYNVEQDSRIDSNKELMLYRITQEQINNICKYAKAENVSISVTEKSRNILLLICDDGVGFDTNKKIKGIGLKNIQNRVEYYSGLMNIVSVPGEGCRLEISIPL